MPDAGVRWREKSIGDVALSVARRSSSSRASVHPPRAAPSRTWASVYHAGQQSPTLSAAKRAAEGVRNFEDSAGRRRFTF